MTDNSQSLVFKTLWKILWKITFHMRECFSIIHDETISCTFITRQIYRIITPRHVKNSILCNFFADPRMAEDIAKGQGKDIDCATTRQVYHKCN